MLATVKNSAVNAVFSIWSIIELANLQGWQYQGGQGAMVPPPPPFLRCKKKKKEIKEKQKSLKAETIKRLSPRSKCY